MQCSDAMAAEGDTYACAAVVVGSYLQDSRPPRKIWTEDWLLKRDVLGSYATLQKELRLSSKLFNKYLRMPVETYEYILSKISPIIRKEQTNMRNPISPGARLEATLLFLLSGMSYSRLAYVTRIHETTLGKIIPEVCDAIYMAMREEFVKTPTTETEWLKVSNGFEHRWQFPNCLGAVDGKHVQIVPPPHSGSYYYNYKGNHSIVLMAVANSDYEVIYADIGGNGRVSDGGIWGDCTLRNGIENGTIGLPGPKNLPNSTRLLPHAFVGDEAFPLKKYLLKPFPHRNQTDEQRIFSYRLSRARRIIENVFGIMTMRFRILQNPINLHPKKVQKVVLAIVTLHNILRKLSVDEYQPPGSVDRENVGSGTIASGSWRSNQVVDGLESSSHHNNASEEAKHTRVQYMRYFLHEGAVPWQKRMVGLE